MKAMMHPSLPSLLMMIPLQKAAQMKMKAQSLRKKRKRRKFMMQFLLICWQNCQLYNTKEAVAQIRAKILFVRKDQPMTIHWTSRTVTANTVGISATGTATLNLQQVMITLPLNLRRIRRTACHGRERPQCSVLAWSQCVLILKTLELVLLLLRQV